MAEIVVYRGRARQRVRTAVVPSYATAPSETCYYLRHGKLPKMGPDAPSILVLQPS
jgi:hypothetical protein